MLKLRFWALCLPSILLLSCKADVGDPSHVLIDSFSEKSTASFIEDVYSDVRLVPLELDGHLLGSSMLMLLEQAGEGYILTDRQSQAGYLFNPDGSLRTYISKVGRGPGEYNSLEHVKYQDHKIVALADGDHVIEYSEAGDLIRESFLDYDFMDFQLFRDKGAAFLVSRSDGEDEVCDRIIFTDTLFQKTASFFPQAFQLFNYESHLSRVGDDEYLYVPVTSTQIYQCRMDEVVKTYDIDLHGKEFPDSILKADDFEVMLDVMMRTPEIYYVPQAFENQDFLLLGLGNIIDGEDKDSGVWLIDLKDMSSRIEYCEQKSVEYSFFGPPQMLTPDNEVVFICDLSLYDEVKNSVPGLSRYDSLFADCPSDSALLFCKIGE